MQLILNKNVSINLFLNNDAFAIDINTLQFTHVYECDRGECEKERTRKRSGQTMCVEKPDSRFIFYFSRKEEGERKKRSESSRKNALKYLIVAPEIIH